MIDFSILICVYNPDERLLSKCIYAVNGLDTSNISLEVILVDNNSNPSLNTYPIVQNAQKIIPNLITLVEPKQGISHARVAGIKAARGKYIVIFDGDNDPHSDYLQVLSKLIEQHSSVGAWGPGNVWVNFIDGVDDDLKIKAMELFQERHDDFTVFACLRSWQDCYPFGTGLCIKTEHALLYVNMFESGNFTLKGREGNRLSSGEDTQMVLCCIISGYAAGRSPDLKMNHVIPASRANLNYMKRLAYGGHIDYDLIMTQVMPEYKANFGNPLKKACGVQQRFTKRWQKQFYQITQGKSYT
ncbi:glycosyltransferase [Niabella hibiscisoli]|uniref:glycosyltransferase n=1 Tax=Niabella hibiscisoli TaxID=1825928 RepID=UPI001F10B717|nr:glycosyltransferase [Niabella hibiscisoli]MCH5716527.1 glycosyltransferase family 2 protein [Niabella hibiscisoli]